MNAAVIWTDVTTAMAQLWPALDLAAAAVFAITGALVASRKQLDVVAFVWLGIVTGIGGGTVRDLLLGVPVFWVRDPTPLIVCILAALATYATAHLPLSRYRALLWLDAVGLALVTIAGTAKALDVGVSPVVAVAMGVITAALGGIIRDTLGQEPSIILRREIYVTATLIGAIMFAALDGFNRPLAAICGCGVAFAIRGLAIARGWTLPVYRSRAGRTVEEIDEMRQR
jgi:uncharacterized membrane protein YeiH